MSFVLLVRKSTRALSSSSKKLKSDRTKALLDRIIRVDHAGEYGAVRIYEGQLAVLGRTEVAPIIKVSKLFENCFIKKREDWLYISFFQF